MIRQRCSTRFSGPLAGDYSRQGVRFLVIGAMRSGRRPSCEAFPATNIYVHYAPAGFELDLLNGAATVPV
jgi:hypothetical protein